jgi:predicted permease
MKDLDGSKHVCAAVHLLIDSLISVFLIIVLGAVLRRVLLPSDEAWSAIERVGYYVFFPALMIRSLAGANLASAPVLAVSGALVATILIMSLLVVLAQPWLERRLGMGGPAFTSLYQGALRWNAFIAIAVAGNLYGQEGLTLASIAVAAMIPLVNFLSLWVLRRWGTAGSGSFLRGLMTNPFMVGTLIGIAINVVGLPIPRFLDLTLTAMASAALGVGLLLVGAGLKLEYLTRPGAALTLAVALRLIALPLLGAGIALALGLKGAALAVVVICLGVPTASASYILARQMGGDAPLMAAILTAQTLVSGLTLPILLILFSG